MEGLKSFVNDNLPTMGLFIGIILAIISELKYAKKPDMKRALTIRLYVLKMCLQITEWCNLSLNR